MPDSRDAELIRSEDGWSFFVGDIMAIKERDGGGWTVSLYNAQLAHVRGDPTLLERWSGARTEAPRAKRRWFN